MRRYESIFILRPSLNEEEISTIVSNSTGIITADNGKVIDLDRWGLKRLAYPIQKEQQGFYVFFDYAGTPEAVAEMERKFRIDDSVLRYMTIKSADVISEDEVAEASKEAETKKAQAEEEAKEVETAPETKEAEKTEKPAEETTNEATAESE